jgi:AmmeMemoRadiSam system protein B
MYAPSPVDRCGARAIPRRVRPPAHAGTSYPADARALRSHLDDFFAEVRTPATTTLAGLVAPHIDLRVGGPAYGHAYGAVRAATPAARYVVLGTSHAPGRGRFAATHADYATPLGVAPTDHGFLARLAGRCAGDLFRDQHLHEREHAIEFQAVLLRHVLGNRADVSIVPILVSSFHDLLRRGVSPVADPEIAAFVAALRTTLAEDDVPTVVIAGVDFAHVGAKFGDRGGATPALLATMEAKDRRLLAALEAADPTAFWRELAIDGDRTRICGAAPLLVFLELMRGRRGRTLAYDRYHEHATRSCVTYASLAYPGA